MALAPGEVFQHAHLDRSITLLVQGTVDLEVGDKREPLVTGLPTPIDAELPHRLINVGSQLAVLKCVHADAEIVPPTH